MKTLAHLTKDKDLHIPNFWILNFPQCYTEQWDRNLPTTKAHAIQHFATLYSRILLRNPPAFILQLDSL